MLSSKSRRIAVPNSPEIRIVPKDVSEPMMLARPNGEFTITLPWPPGPKSGTLTAMNVKKKNTAK